jgi:small subunit ribosomal protein S20
MPITDSAKKALRQNARRKVKNVARKDAYKKTVRDIKKLLAAKDTKDIQAKLSAAYQALDKAAKGGAIKKNKASRLKSRITRRVNGKVG